MEGVGEVVCVSISVMSTVLFFQHLKPFYQHLLKFVCTFSMTPKSLLNPLLGLG